jgi:hypothetical protein
VAQLRQREARRRRAQRRNRSNKPATPTVIVNVNGNSAETVAPEVDDGDEDNTDGSGMMMFPQQQKLEIMKKMAGIPNHSSKLKTIVADEDEPFDG